jgi:alginate O-acetyltransferase complex protein AlgI
MPLLNLILIRVQENLNILYDNYFSLEFLKSVLLYSEESPLLFTRSYFWIFFAVVMVLFSFFHKKIWLRNAYLFLISLFFYYKTSGLFISILIFSTLSDFVLGKAISKSKMKTPKLLLLSMSVMINLFVLSYFKYAYFFTDSYNAIFDSDLKVFNWLAHFANFATSGGYEVNNILLPVGISFYTFQTISYSVDIYRNRIQPVKSILDFGFYVSFFPQLVAGPIVRANEFVPQLHKSFQLDRKIFGFAVFMILNGLIKKLVLGDYIAVNFIDRVFDNPVYFTGLENLLALFGYSLQVYADFSGYTDMAIGIAVLMGFTLPRNFNSPYKAKNVGEFWKRWHISLSTWLKDYLYIPLGGNRNASFFTWFSSIAILAIVLVLVKNPYLRVSLTVIAAITALMLAFNLRFRRWMVVNINLMITMLLGGLWHGASLQFIIWGGLNGLALIVYKNWRKISPWENNNSWIANAWKIGITFTFITFTRIWFRSETMETSMIILDQIWNNFRADLALEIFGSYKQPFLVILAGLIIHWLPDHFKLNLKERFSSWPMMLQAGFSALVVFMVYQTLTADLQPFIYFQF